MNPRNEAASPSAHRRGTGWRPRALGGVAAALLLPAIAAAQAPQAGTGATPLIAPSRQFPSGSIQSEPLAPPPGVNSPSLTGPPQSGIASPPAPPQPAAPPSAPEVPNVITPGAGQMAPGLAAPATQGGTAAPPPAIQGTVPPASVAQPPAAAQTPTVTTPGAQPQQPATGQPQAAAPPPPNPWQPQGAAVVQVLDKPDAQNTTLTIKVGQSATYRSLTITVKACDIRPPEMPPDATAFLEITDSHAGQPGFSGWILQSDPALNMLQNPIYDVRVKGCTP